ncbi:MAG: helix-turn-helix transcriptional regulator [Acidimicrobiales bacterium]
MPPSSVSAARRRVLDQLKQDGPATASTLARDLELTDVAVRQHLTALERQGFVAAAVSAPAGPGRPAVRWFLTERAGELFPDGHGELITQLISSLRSVTSERTLQRVIDARADGQIETYRAATRPDGPGRPSVRRRVESLARQRSAEGYMAEAIPDGDGGVLLVEHHCPIADAARTCAGFCRSELEVFRRAVGDDASVERVEHMLSGDSRCAYRIRATG